MFLLIIRTSFLRVPCSKHWILCTRAQIYLMETCLPVLWGLNVQANLCLFMWDYFVCISRKWWHLHLVFWNQQHWFVDCQHECVVAIIFNIYRDRCDHTIPCTVNTSNKFRMLDNSVLFIWALSICLYYVYILCKGISVLFSCEKEFRKEVIRTARYRPWGPRSCETLMDMSVWGWSQPLTLFVDDMNMSHVLWIYWQWDKQASCNIWKRRVWLFRNEVYIIMYVLTGIW